ncbi:hypothetical protein ABGB07_34135 [Micromonosporaceae bacterium B7E4]
MNIAQAGNWVLELKAIKINEVADTAAAWASAGRVLHSGQGQSVHDQLNGALKKLAGGWNSAAGQAFQKAGKQVADFAISLQQTASGPHAQPPQVSLSEVADYTHTVLRFAQGGITGSPPLRLVTEVAKEPGSFTVVEPIRALNFLRQHYPGLSEDLDNYLTSNARQPGPALSLAQERVHQLIVREATTLFDGLTRTYWIHERLVPTPPLPPGVQADQTVADLNTPLSPLGGLPFEAGGMPLGSNGDRLLTEGGGPLAPDTGLTPTNTGGSPTPLEGGNMPTNGAAPPGGDGLTTPTQGGATAVTPGTDLPTTPAGVVPPPPIGGGTSPGGLTPGGLTPGGLTPGGLTPGGGGPVSPVGGPVLVPPGLLPAGGRYGGGVGAGGLRSGGLGGGIGSGGRVTPGGGIGVGGTGSGGLGTGARGTGTGTGAATGAAGMYPPMYPPMGGGAGMGERDDQRHNGLVEDDEFWQVEVEYTPAVVTGQEGRR